MGNLTFPDFLSLPEKLTGQHWFGKVLRMPLKLIPRNTILPIMYGPSAGMYWIAGSHTHGCWLGTYEINVRRRFEERITENDIVFDIGAHVGFYSLIASSLVGDSGRVVSLEPCPRNLNHLLRHVQLNECKNVEILGAACDETNGLASFRTKDDRHAQSHLSNEGNMFLPTIKLDTLLKNYDFPAPDHMKIDVEGSELKVLKGGREVIQTHRPTIFLSLHSEALSHRCLDLLDSWGYHVETVEKGQEGFDTEIIAFR